jgi:hypothetical protein
MYNPRNRPAGFIRQAARAAATALTAAIGLAAAPAVADNNSTAILPQDKFRLELITVGNGLKTDGHTAVGLIYGFGPDKPRPFGRWEAGVEYVLSAGPFSGSAIPQSTNPSLPVTGLPPAISTGQRAFWNIKTQLYDNPETGVRVALGGYLLGSSKARAGNLGFLAISKQTKKYGYFHTGWVHSFSPRAVRNTPAGNGDRDYFQLDYAYPVLPRLIAGFNFYTGNAEASVFFPAIIYFLTPNYDSSITIGDFRWNDSSVRPTRDQIYIQFDYYWDRAPKRRPMPPSAPPQPAPASSGVGP